MQVPRPLLHLMHLPPRAAYALGLGPLLGPLILLLTTTGRKSGRPRVTPLQYEEIDGCFYIGAMRGRGADWFRNLSADPRVQLQVGARRFSAVAQPITNPSTIADFLELRIRRHPRMIPLILRLDGLSAHPDRAALEAYAARLALVVLRPIEPLRV